MKFESYSSVVIIQFLRTALQLQSTTDRESTSDILPYKESKQRTMDKEFSKEVIQGLREALAQTPNNTALRLHLAQILLEQDHVIEASELLREALRARPQDLQIQVSLAEAYFRQQKLSAAQVLLDEILKSKEAPAEAHLILAQILLQLQQPGEAQSAYQKAIERNPSLQTPEFDRQFFVHVSQQLNQQSTSTQIQSTEPTTPGDHMAIPLRQPAAQDFMHDVSDLLSNASSSSEKPLISFADVGGMESIKEAIELKIIQPLRQPDLYRAYGKSIGGGLLLYGPPGCGKTHLARATAGEVQADFISVGINDILEMWLGQSERNLHEIFEQARSQRPCVLFFDEVDALGASRSDMRHSAGRQLINQFLLELDGVKYANEGLLILAATNAPWHLDTAFRRPGRFDRMIFVPPPDLNSRLSILNILLIGKPCEKLDVLALAKKTEGFSGADLKAIVDQAIEEKLKVAMKTGLAEPLRQKDLLKVAKAVRPSTREWFTSARNYALYANQSGFYDDILAYLNLK